MMWSKELLLTTILSLSFRVICVSHFPRSTRHGAPLHVRNYATEATIADSYDFVIAGGGLAGLVIASRLSEDSNTTVLVLEAGDTGDAVLDAIDTPDAAYYPGLVGTAYDWQHKTVPQGNANGRVITWPRGKVLGGSSAINGMYFVRPSSVEVDAWKNIIESEDGSSEWGWDNFFTAMKKSETFTPPSSDIQKSANIRFDAASVGSDGPNHVSYPGFTFGVVGDWTPSLEGLGIESATDPAGGKNYGGYVSAVSINPTNWTRSYSKSAYIDPLPPRKNLDILASTTVTRIIFGDTNSSSGDQVATGVEFARSAGVAKKTVKVNKEVIVTGGALGSAHILQLSGVGPKDVLDAAGVPVKAELPGVGQHLQDHLSAPVIWQSNVQTAGDLHASGSDFSKEAITMSFINSAVAYINTSTLFGGNIADLQNNIVNALDTSSTTLVPSQYKEVVEGYKTIYNATQKLLSEGLGQIELLLSINAPKQIAIQAALQHPYSQGRIYITSASVFDPIVVDPQYFSHFADRVILREGIKLARQLGKTAPMSNSLGAEILPGPDVSTDDQIDTWLAGVSSTEFHPAATCAMLPKSQGGVVNPKLQVYGLANVRVADSSVFPLSFSAHLASPTYGMAEKAAEIIKAFYTKPPTSNSSSSSSDNSTINNNGGQGNKSGAASVVPLEAVWTVIVGITASLVHGLIF